MRAVNLIPPEDRRGERAAARRGAAAYAVVGALAVGLGAISMLVLTNNDIAEKTAQISALEAEEAAARAEADRLRAFADFASLQQAREETVSTLARSRFDWERVLRELAIVIPPDVWLTNVSATVTPQVQLEGAEPVALESGVSGPSLSLVGCGASHEAVARFAATLEDIDGVTRVGIGKSERPDQETASSSSEAGGSTDCRTRDFIAQFEIVATFDEVQVDTTTGLPVPPAEPATQDDGGASASVVTGAIR